MFVICNRNLQEAIPNLTQWPNCLCEVGSALNRATNLTIHKTWTYMQEEALHP